MRPLHDATLTDMSRPWTAYRRLGITATATHADTQVCSPNPRRGSHQKGLVSGRLSKEHIIIGTNPSVKNDRGTPPWETDKPCTEFACGTISADADLFLKQNRKIQQVLELLWRAITVTYLLYRDWFLSFWIYNSFFTLPFSKQKQCGGA